MTRRDFAKMTETFGYDTARPWGEDVFRLLFNVPRAFDVLVEAWDDRHPGAKRALRRLVDGGWVARQDGIIIDTLTGERATKVTRRVERWRTTSRGRRARASWDEDIRRVVDDFPRVRDRHLRHAHALLEALDLDDSHARYGLSANHAIALSGFETRLGRWWIHRFEEKGLIRQIETAAGEPLLLADTREVIPAHWRPTRMLARQLTDLARSLDSLPETVIHEFRLGRTRYLDDVDPARVGISGATDYDHDIDAQRILASLLSSPRLDASAIFQIEPRISLHGIAGAQPMPFDEDGSFEVNYLPDAMFRERHDGVARRAVLEYERFQSRRDAWSHIERLVGYMHTLTHPFESSVLYFVVDSPARQRSYVELIEAFADFALEEPERMCRNQVTLAVSYLDRVLASPDPLDPMGWSRIPLPRAPEGSAPRPVLHDPKASPYELYFGRYGDPT